MGEHNGGNGHGGPTFLAPAISERGEGVFRGRGGRTPRALAHGGGGWKQMVEDGTFLYWTDSRDGTITRLPKDGGIPLVLASEQNEPEDIALAGGYLYWTNLRGGTVVRMPTGGGEIETLASGQHAPGPIAVAGEDVVWGNRHDYLNGTLMKGTTGGAPPVTIASKQLYPGCIALDDDCIYWTTLGTKRPDYFSNGAVMKMPRALPPEGQKKKRQVIARPQICADGIAVDDEWVYWTTCGYFPERFEDGTVMRRRKRGGAPEPLVIGARSASTMALDATHVYWIESWERSIRRVPKGGGEPEEIVAGSSNEIFQDGLVVDDRFVYWTVTDSEKAGGAIWKIAK
jgi:sugar lactone lactonase YvrE